MLNIAMYTLFNNNIVSDTIYSVVIYVDFLGIHMARLILFLKLGVTYAFIFVGRFSNYDL